MNWWINELEDVWGVALERIFFSRIIGGFSHSCK